MMMSSRNSAVLARRVLERQGRGALGPQQQRSHSTMVPASGKWAKPMPWVLVGTLVTVATIGSSRVSNNETGTTSLDALQTLPLPLVEYKYNPTPVSLLPRATEPIVVEPIDIAVEPIDINEVKLMIEEPVTGIFFPPEFRSKQLLGLGVRKKYRFINVYAIAMYADSDEFKGLSQEDYQEALLDPTKNRILRIKMNRTVTMDQVIAAMIEAIKPRMHGKDLHALEHFAKLRSYGTLDKGDDVLLTIREDCVELDCSRGEDKTTSPVFARAVCDVYFGKETISPSAKASVLAAHGEL